MRVVPGAQSGESAPVLHGLVLVSLGGNDASFGKIATVCIGLGDCTDVVDAWTKDLAGVESRLGRAYDALRSVIGSQVPVLVVPYPSRSPRSAATSH